MELGDTDGKLTFQEAVLAVSSLKMGNQLEKPIVKRSEKGILNVGDLPLRMLLDSTTYLTQFCDVILEQDDFDLDAVERVCSIGQYKQLPEPLRFSVSILW